MKTTSGVSVTVGTGASAEGCWRGRRAWQSDTAASTMDIAIRPAGAPSRWQVCEQGWAAGG